MSISYFGCAFSLFYYSLIGNDISVNLFISMRKVYGHNTPDSPSIVMLFKTCHYAATSCIKMFQNACTLFQLCLEWLCGCLKHSDRSRVCVGLCLNIVFLYCSFNAIESISKNTDKLLLLVFLYIILRTLVEAPMTKIWTKAAPYFDKKVKGRERFKVSCKNYFWKFSQEPQGLWKLFSHDVWSFSV